MLASIGIGKAGKGTEPTNTFTGFANKGFSLAYRLMAKPAQVLCFASQVLRVAVQVLRLAIPTLCLAKPDLNTHVKRLGKPYLHRSLPSTL